MEKKIKVVESTKTIKIVEHFTNFFAQEVYKLADGTEIFISSNRVEIRQTREIAPEKLSTFLNAQNETN